MLSVSLNKIYPSFLPSSVGRALGHSNWGSVVRIPSVEVGLSVTCIQACVLSCVWTCLVVGDLLENVDLNTSSGKKLGPEVGDGSGTNITANICNEVVHKICLNKPIPPLLQSLLEIYGLFVSSFFIFFFSFFCSLIYFIFCGFFFFYFFFFWGGRGFGVHVLICRDILDLNSVLEKRICPFPEIIEILFDF